MKVLETRFLEKHFYHVAALKGVDIRVEEGDLLGLIGPNGSGKTTLFDCITGILRPNGGKIFFKGRDITNSSFAPLNKGLRLTIIFYVYCFEVVKGS